jgi:hypothetical protein
MVSDPEPLESVRVIHGQSSVMQTHTHRVNWPDLFEAERRVTGIRLQERKVFVRQITDCIGEPLIGCPEIRISVVVQRGVTRPASRCSPARLRDSFKRPAVASRSIWRSHWSATYSSNHWVKTESSCAESFETAFSIS